MPDTSLEGFARYAVYYAPPRGSMLARLGAGWLGHDAEADAPPPAPDVAGLPREREALVARPRRYGFHATLKAPFRLAEGATAAELDAALVKLTAGLTPAEAPGLEVRTGDGFVALRPGDPAPELDALAAELVRELDGFRAPLMTQERVRRMEGLDPTETAHLERWGYPYVFDRFHFHMTLAGPLSEDEAARTAEALAPVFQPSLEPVFRVGEVALFGDPGDGRPFELLRRRGLGR